MVQNKEYTMLDKLKEFWSKFKGLLAILAAGIAVIFLVLKHDDKQGLGEYLKKQNNAEDDAKKKLEVGTQKIEQEKEEKLKQVDKETEQKLAEAEKEVKKESKQLEALEKTNKDEFKSQLEKQLGVKEKKKGRSKRR
jgi:hypothetical protein